ncbi:MAG: glycine cleavage system aminomethyltransferase GcvT [Candidatus Binatus sp.]|uniref:glycine cleavage system aminomethyltransferase GcvT n=1 Tax=Candidatus Binatus sp. TaxID=2811406 RepID=UPI002727A279|nr:glycine cleavage system aminomethyltransferase GcvT [Candidatus Binatus sp.]MDO8431719.1 glycine cleavage system aminomethyltransferase GcvT [Candidatus Binatus sp.]
MNEPKRTILFDIHRKLRAKMTEFGGFEMPVSYSGIIEEHRAVRNAAGIFDLSHMGEFEVRGPNALALLEGTFTNSASKLKEGQAQYTVMCTEDGGTIDDLIVYRLGPQRYMLCVNASNIDVDREWIVELNAGLADFEDVSDASALVAVQGPRAIEIVAKVAEFPVAEIARFGVAIGKVAGVACIVARTGYTGEDGVELFVENSRAEHLFEAIFEAGAPDGIKPIGLGARDTLRLEAGLPLYGHELDRETSPLEAGLGIFVKLGRPFIGEPALSAQRQLGLKKRLAGLMTDDGKNVARQGYPILRDGRRAGIVTSGTFAPSLERPVAMGYLTGDDAAISDKAGSALEVEIRGRKVPAKVVARPFYRRAATGATRSAI